MDWPEILVKVVFGLAMYYLGWRGHRKSTENPYKWACMVEDCDFTVSSNDQQTVIAYADAHEERHRL